MCGIVGIIAKKSWGFTHKEIDAFEQLLYVDGLRGQDATGVITVTKDGDFYIDKAAKPALEFLPEYDKTDSSKCVLSKGIALIGHNRKSTIGVHSDKNAHPFVVNDRFALVHNGTLYNHKQLADTDVDSEALAQVIEKAVTSEYTDDLLLKPKFHKEKLEEVLQEVFGAYACVWYNQLDHNIQFVRNDQRPLWIADCDGVYAVASEPGMLHWVLSRNGIKIEKMEEVTKEVLYTIDLDLDYQTEATVFKQELDVKKPLLPTVITPTVTEATTTLGGTPFEVSKNKYKRLRKRILSTRIDFFVDDFVEKHPFINKDERDYVVWGTAPGLDDWAHMLKGNVNLDTLGLKAIGDYEKYIFSGLVAEMDYDPILKLISISLEHIKAAPLSLASNGGSYSEGTTTLQ